MDPLYDLITRLVVAAERIATALEIQAGYHQQIEDEPDPPQFKHLGQIDPNDP